MKERKVSINVSLDAGTSCTFAKIKGGGWFEKVLQNLEKYSSTGGSLELKYILLEGINDNEAEINSFISIATKLTKQVLLSFDTNKIGKKFSEYYLKMISYFIINAKKANLSMQVIYMTVDSEQAGQVRHLHEKIQKSAFLRRVIFEKVKVFIPKNIKESIKKWLFSLKIV